MSHAANIRSRQRSLQATSPAKRRKLSTDASSSLPNGLNGLLNGIASAASSLSAPPSAHISVNKRAANDLPSTVISTADDIQPINSTVQGNRLSSPENDTGNESDSDSDSSAESESESESESGSGSGSESGSSSGGEGNRASSSDEEKEDIKQTINNVEDDESDSESSEEASDAATQNHAAKLLTHQNPNTSSQEDQDIISISSRMSPSLVSDDEQPQSIHQVNDIASPPSDQEDSSPTFGDILSARGPTMVDVEASYLDPNPDNALTAAGPPKPLNIPSATSLGTVLTQALRTNDAELLESCFHVSHLESIRATIERLPSPLAVFLLQRLAERMHKRPGRAGSLMVWVQWTVVAHGGYLAGQAEAMRHLKTLYKVVKQRAAGLQPLLALKGKLDMLEAQMQIRRNILTAQRMSRQEEVDEPVIYVEGEEDSSDEDAELSHGRAGKLDQPLADALSADGDEFDEDIAQKNSALQSEEDSDEGESDNDLLDDEAEESDNDSSDELSDDDIIYDDADINGEGSESELDDDEEDDPPTQPAKRSKSSR